MEAWISAETQTYQFDVFLSEWSMFVVEMSETVDHNLSSKTNHPLCQFKPGPVQQLEKSIERNALH